MKNLDHLGLVAGIIDAIGIVDKINELIEEKKTEKVRVGQVVKAMILNGMGLVSSPLYIFGGFFDRKGDRTFTRERSQTRVFECSQTRKSFR